MQKEEILQNLNLEAYYVSELPSLKVRNNKAQALCPFHEDSKPSLSIDLTTGSFHCFGCAKKGSVFDFCMEKQGIGFKEANNALAGFTGLLSEPQKEIVKTYNYKDESGNLLYQAVRYEPKDFTQRRPDGKGGWIWNLEGVRRIPYNLPDVIKAQEVFIVEGEKDADNLNAIDLIATTCPGGANKWRKEYNEYFKGKKVVVIPDNDEPGRKHGQDIAKNLKGIAESIKIIEFPGLPEKGDITDWIAGGGTKERLLELVKEAPEWQPPKEEPEETDRDSNLLPVCSFPFEVFPLQLREIINKLSTSLHIAPDVASACLLPIIGSAVGNSVRVSPKDGWEEAPFIWLALIAKTGYGKSPLVQKLFKPLECLQGKAYQEYKEKGQEYERLLALAKKDKLLFPEKPKLKQYLVSDFTIEALSEVFEGDSRGVIITADELAGLIWGLNQYKGKGNDRQHILQLWNAHSWKIDRKTGVKFIPNTGASIIGGIQPRVLPQVFSENSLDEGLLPRFLLLQAEDKPQKFSRQTMTDNDLAQWSNLLHRCYKIPLNKSDDGFVRPTVLKLSDGAVDAFESFHNLQTEIKLVLPDRAGAFIPKLLAYCLKFAGILHIIKAIDESISLDRLISKETMNNAIALTKFFGGQVNRVLGLYDSSKTLNEYQERLVRTLYNLQEEVKNGKLPLSRIGEVFNGELSKNIRYTPERIKTTLKELRLNTQLSTGGYSNLLWESEKIKKLFLKTTSTTSTTSTIGMLQGYKNDKIVEVVEVVEVKVESKKPSKVVTDKQEEAIKNPNFDDTAEKLYKEAILKIGDNDANDDKVDEIWKKGKEGKATIDEFKEALNEWVGLTMKGAERLNR